MLSISSYGRAAVRYAQTCLLQIPPLKKKNAHKKQKKRDSQLVVRISGDERDEFIALCEAMDTSASREIRRFIKEYLAAHAETADEIDPAMPAADGTTEENQDDRQSETASPDGGEAA